MIETVVDGIELDDKFLDDLFVAIRDKIPSDIWVPIKKDHERVVSGLKYIIDCRCYGENFDLALHENMTHFRKISAFQPQYNTAKPVSDHPAEYWTKQDELRISNEKAAYYRVQRAEQLELNKKFKKKRK